MGLGHFPVNRFMATKVLIFRAVLACEGEAKFAPREKLKKEAIHPHFTSESRQKALKTKQKRPALPHQNHAKQWRIRNLGTRPHFTSENSVTKEA